jgi:hypothetical protein
MAKRLGCCRFETIWASPPKAVGLWRVPRRAAAPAASRPYRAAIPDADFAGGMKLALSGSLAPARRQGQGQACGRPKAALAFSPLARARPRLIATPCSRCAAGATPAGGGTLSFSLEASA